MRAPYDAYGVEMPIPTYTDSDTDVQIQNAASLGRFKINAKKSRAANCFRNFFLSSLLAFLPASRYSRRMAGR